MILAFVNEANKSLVINLFKKNKIIIKCSTVKYYSIANMRTWQNVLVSLTRPSHIKLSIRLQSRRVCNSRRTNKSLAFWQYHWCLQRHGLFTFPGYNSINFWIRIRTILFEQFANILIVEYLQHIEIHFTRSDRTKQQVFADFVIHQH